AKIIKFTTIKGDWVLDPFAGRGTTGIACVSLGRNFTGIDLYNENTVKIEKNITDLIKGKFTVRINDLTEDDIYAKV
ncbi:MAG: hypothetical protein ICV56_05245, partial [Nitrososphaeraceae archaeon]|nr:hypothetical protein [Nitrososphaeraceae archaeon]